MAFKLQMVFNLGRNGWTEAWYLPTDSLDVTVRKAYEIATARYAVLASNASMDGLRISDTVNRGSTLPLPPPPKRSGGVVTVAFQAHQALLWSLRFGGNATGNPNLPPGVGNDTLSIYRRNYEMRGCPWLSVLNVPAVGQAAPGLIGTQETQQKINPANSGDFAAYFLAVNSNGGGDLVKTKSAQPFTITGIDKDINNNTILICAGNPPYNQNDTITIAGMSRGCRSLNGQTTVIKTVAPSPNVLTIGKPFPGAVFFPPAYVQGKFMQLVKVNDWRFDRTVVRDTGKSFFVTRGRSKRRAINT